MSVLPACANCGTTLQGPYCSHCGQKASDYHKPIWWIIGEFMDAVFSYDSRTFRTIWLLFSEPGEFTRRYNAGQRASMLPPFRLFLIATVVFFLTLQLTGLALVGLGTKTVALDDMTAEELEVFRKEAPAIIKGADGKSITALELQFFMPVNDARRHKLTPEERQQLERGREDLKSQKIEASNTDSAAWLKSLQAYGERVLQGLERAIDDPVKLNGPLNVWLPRIMLFLVPVFALLLALMHWWPRVYYVEHLIFALHVHTVAFFALTLVALAVAVFGGLGFLELAIGPILAVYFWMALKRVYGRGIALTTVKFAAILFIYSTILTASLSMAFVQALTEV